MKEKFELANQDRMKDLQVEVDKILEALKCDGALVTDESEVGDFIDIFAETEEIEANLKYLSNYLGVFVEDDMELIVDIAQKIKDKKCLVKK
jgi:hypothetical protein